MREKTGFFTTIDEHLLARARRGDRAAVESLYRVFAGPVHNLGLRLCGTIEEAEEILQETFLEVVRSLASFRGDAPLGAWIRRVAVSKVLNRRRRAEVRRIEVELENCSEFVGERPTLRGTSQATGIRIDLERALGELPETSRIVLWLHDVEGMTHQEIGELMGRTASFSKSQLARSHAKLRHWFNKAWSQENAPDHRTAAGCTGQ